MSAKDKTQKYILIPVPDSEPPRPLRRGRPPAKHSNPDYRQLTVYIRKKVHRAVKRELPMEEPPMEFSDVVDQMLEEWLAGRGVDLNQLPGRTASKKGGAEK